MNLSLDHVPNLNEILTPVHIGVVMGLLILALIVLAFSKRWFGLLLGIAILGGSLGLGGYLGYQAKTSTEPAATKTVLHTNTQRVQTWSAKQYNLKFTTTQAEALATGTETFTQGARGDQQFGTVDNVNVFVGGGSISVPVTLFYTNQQWSLAYNDGSKYVRVPAAK